MTYTATEKKGEHKKMNSRYALEGDRAISSHFAPIDRTSTIIMNEFERWVPDYSRENSVVPFYRVN